MPQYTTTAQLEADYATLFATFASGKTKDVSWRKWQLKQLWWMVSDNEIAIMEALHTDLHRSQFESFAAEIRTVKEDILAHLKNIDEWTKDDVPDAGIFYTKFCAARVRKEPLGVALIIGPWNFPISLILCPLVAAITAGCCAYLKPSDIASASENCLTKLIPQYLDTSAIRVTTGGIAETTELLKHRFNFIFFTGSTKVGRIVQEAAARHLTPTVLELGGQGPSIITKSADLNLAAKKIAYAKFTNAGQICLTVNHIFVDASVHDDLLEKIAFWFDQFMQNDGSEQFCRIISDRNFDRLTGLLDATDGKIVYGGKSDRQTRYIQPTIISNVTYKDSIMSEELFGPYLPVIKADCEAACRAISSGEHPLAIYLFTHDKEQIDYVLKNTNSGGITINDVFMHAGVPNAPFGGVGNSGSGYYHGKYGFLAFCSLRTVVQTPSWLESLTQFRYPPYTASGLRKLAVSVPGFQRHETVDDQNHRSGSFPTTLRFALSKVVQLCFITLVFTLVDYRMGGNPSLTKYISHYYNKKL